MHAIELADSIICDPVRLCSVTGCTKESFEIVLKRFTDAVMADGGRFLFWKDNAKNKDAGNRCKLHIRHALLAVLMNLRANATQQHLAATFDIDQSTMSRCLQHCIVILRQILPVAEKIADIICKIPADKIMADGGRTHVICPRTGYTVHRFNARARMLRWHEKDRDGFEKMYHQRSLVESAFSSIKARFDSTVRAMSLLMQSLRLTLKVFCYNLVS